MSQRMIALLCLAPMAAILVAAVVEDVRKHRIPNVLVFSGMVLGIVFNVVMPDGFGFAATNLPGGVGFLKALMGGGVALVVLLPIYLLRAMGAGDVKLMAMVGVFLGSRDIAGALLAVFMAGGILSIGYAWKVGVLRQTLRNIRMMLYFGAAKFAAKSLPVLDDAPKTAAKFPYAVAIASGTLGYLAWKMA